MFTQIVNTDKALFIHAIICAFVKASGAEMPLVGPTASLCWARWPVSIIHAD
ncbi:MULTISPECIES: hypothetical protein [Shouchella]|uniref:hypothetical protein n=1 Tax=Shouchella TaxID=2893057 RepID=UPI0015CE897A|nr:hypothetical protein [Shouchella clausii]